VYSTQTGPPREILQGRTTLICCPIKPLVNFHKSLREFYIIIYLYKLKLHVVENTPKNEKNKNKTSMAKASGPSEIHGPLLGSPDTGPMYRLNPPLICPGHNFM
jgi:hypothetical protein